MLSLQGCRVSRWLVALFAALALNVASAEVGVSTESGEVIVVYKLKAIVDDPDPNGIWARYHADSPSRRVLNDQGVVNGDGPPSIVRNAASSTVLAAWSRSSPTGFDIVISSFAQNAWSLPTIVVGSPSDELDPVLVVSPTDNSVHLFYWLNDAAPTVMYTQAPADLSSWSPAIQVSAPGEVACRPHAMFHDGSLRVVFESHGPSLGSVPRQIIMATKSGSSFVSETIATTHHEGANRPEIHGRDATLWVDWIDSDNEMAWTTRLPNLQWEPVSIEPFATVEERDFQVRGKIRALALN